MKVWQFLIVLAFGYATYLFGVVRERYSVGMKPSRKWDLFCKSLFTVVSFGRFYICDGCGHIHKRHQDEVDICGGRYRHKVFVSDQCLNEKVLAVHKAIQENASRTSTDSLSLFLRNRANATGPINPYDKSLLEEASQRLDEQQSAILNLRGKLYGNQPARDCKREWGHL